MDSKLENLDIVRVKRTEIFNRQLNSFNFSQFAREPKVPSKKFLKKFYSKVFDGPYGGEGRQFQQNILLDLKLARIEEL